MCVRRGKMATYVGVADQGEGGQQSHHGDEGQRRQRMEENFFLKQINFVCLCGLLGWQGVDGCFVLKGSLTRVVLGASIFDSRCIEESMVFD